MKKITSYICTVTSCAVMCLVGLAQISEHTVHPPKGLILQWDSRNQRLLYHRVSVKPSLPALYTADAQGQQTQSIDILADFPGSRHAVVETVAGGPNGSIVASCILKYDTPALKELILTYNRNGVLKNIIDIYPYETSALAVDNNGNIYSFEVRTDLNQDDPTTAYPTIIEYSPQGQVLRTMLPSSSFAPGDYATEQTVKFGRPLLRLTPNGIAVFSASSPSLFLLSLDGQIIARHDLTNLNQTIANRYNFKRAFILDSFLDQNGGLVLRMGLDDGSESGGKDSMPSTGRFQEPLVRVASSNLAITEVVDNMRNTSGRMIGIDEDGRLVFRYFQADGSARIATVAN